MKRLCVIGFGLAWLVALGCDSPTIDDQVSPEAEDEQWTSDEESGSQSVVHDLGRVKLIDGALRQEHRFQIINHTDDVLEIVNVKPTCGCIDCSVDRHRIPSGESASLDIAIDIFSPGQVTHGAHVVFSDGRVRQYLLTAYGELGVELVPIRDSASITENGIHTLRLYRVDSDGQLLSSPPVLIEPPGVGLRTGEWNLIEDSAGGLRPARQIIDIELDFRGYVGSYPARVVLTTGDGGRTTMMVHEPSGLPLK